MKVRLFRWAASILTSQLYTVRGTSMTPAFQRGDRVLVSRTTYRGEAPARGDAVIVLDPRDGSRRYLKRVVGLPGEEVRLFDGMLIVQDRWVEEPYLEGLPSSVGLADRVWTLTGDEYLVLGDNRAHSTDSREFGPTSRGLIVGKVWFRCWPPRRWGRVDFSAGALAG